MATKAGVSKLDYRRNKFTAFNVKKHSSSGPANIFMVFKDSQKSYWFWAVDGLFRKKDGDERFSLVFPEDQEEKVDTFQGALEDDRSHLWFNTSEGLVSYNLIDESHKRIRFNYTGCDPVYLNKLSHAIRGSGHDIWMSNYCGVIRFNTKTEKYQVFPLPAEERPEGSYRFTAMAFDNDSNLWIGSRKSRLWKLDIHTGVYASFSTLRKVGDHFKSNFILSVTVDAENRIWLGTYGCGLLLFDQKLKTVSAKYATDLLESNVYAVLADPQGYLWVSNSFGITRLNPKSGEVENYSQKEGTFCEEFNEGAYYNASDGAMLMGGQMGLWSFIRIRCVIMTL